MWVIPVKPAHSPGPSAPAICSTIPLKTAMLSAVTQCLGEIHLLQVVQQKLQKKKKISSVRFFVHHAIQGEKVPPLWGRAPRGGWHAVLAGRCCGVKVASLLTAARSDQPILGGSPKSIGLKHMANNAAGYLGFPGLRLAMDDRTWQLFFSSTRWPCFPPEELSSAGHHFTHTPLLWSCQTPKTILPQVPRTFPSWLKIEGQ